jgi:hyperosmotically inducible protein
MMQRTSGPPACPEKHSTGQAISDGVITAKVRASLAADPVTGAYDIHVETFRGIVQLSGFVETTAVRAEALQLACDVQGVQQVKDFLDIRTA